MSKPKWTLLSHKNKIDATSNGPSEKSKSINAETEGIDYEDKSAMEASKIGTISIYSSILYYNLIRFVKLEL